MIDTQSIGTIVRKELRSYFLSPVALIFLGVFSTITLFLFFTYSKFFARNIADVRPLFAWLPVLLIFLVSSLTMRQWSEEQKMGTLEILMTLPVQTWDLVLGKFVAGMALVAVALALTLPLPITVGLLGPLDWGPVIGGYVAAMLLASTYMAIGLCVSARTDNQIVALMISCLVGGAFYLLGSDAVTGLFGHDKAELLRALGTGSRFASIERGVVDLRDLVYYGSLTTFFLLLNVYFLELTRMEKHPKEGAGRRRSLVFGMGLAAANVVALNFWLAPVNFIRADLTADGEYSISPATRRIVAELDEPLRITGYFSSKTHPLLAPLVPRIENLLEEYEVIGGGRIRADFLDPNTDEEIEREINEQYGIKSVPFRVASRHEKSVVNSYFHLLVKYGDQYEVLSYDDLIEVYADETDVQVRLKNLEYDITRAIKKVSQGFQSIESMLARSQEQVSLTAYITEGALPEEYAKVPERVRKVAKEISEKSGGRFRFEVVDPTGKPDLQQELFDEYGFRPMAADLFGESRFYLHLLFRAGDQMERIFPQGDMTEANIRTAIEAAIKRATPGFLKTIAFLTGGSAPDPRNPFAGGGSDYQMLKRVFEADFDFEDVKLEDGVVPNDVDVLLVAKPGDLSDEQLFAIDQYLMRGGAVIALQGAFDVGRDVTATQVEGKLLELLETYGVDVKEKLVMDPQNARFPVPLRVKKGPFVFERVEMMPYPFFPDIRKEGFKDGHIALAGIPSVAMAWASPIELEPPEGVKADVLLRTSEGTWLHESTDLQPDFQKYPEKGFMKTDGAQSHPVAVSLVGTFPSYFADRPSPLFKEESDEDEGGEDDAPEGAEASEPTTAAGTEGEDREADRTGRTLKASTPDARLVVVASSAFVSDMVTQLDFRSGTDSFSGNLVLIRNLVDWALEDTDLLEIRSVGNFARILEPMTSEERDFYEMANYGVVLVALIGVAFLAVTRRRKARPIPLV